MRTFAEIEAGLDAFVPAADPVEAAHRLLAMSEEILEQWVCARGDAPTMEQKEGSRLLALHRQGAGGVPSFNACRETCREIAYHFNVLCGEPGDEAAGRRQRMMALLVKHLLLFVSGKMEVEGLGDFCCASRPLREGTIS